MKPRLSVIIITKNEEEMIGDCLESVKWADEIVVVDSGSSDKTCQIAQKYRARIFKAEGGNFSRWRNLGAKEATNDWLFYVDADERVPSLLKREMETEIEKKEQVFSAFAVPRKNIRLGREMLFGGWRPDYVLRLIEKKKLKGWKGKLHEQPRIEGKIGRLENALVHFSHRGSIEHKFANTINWSKTEARLFAKASHPPMNMNRFVSAMWREFFKRMVRKQAWRDGREGAIEAMYQVFSIFITYARLWELQIRNASEESIWLSRR